MLTVNRLLLETPLVTLPARTQLKDVEVTTPTSRYWAEKTAPEPTSSSAWTVALAVPLFVLALFRVRCEPSCSVPSPSAK